MRVRDASDERERESEWVLCCKFAVVSHLYFTLSLSLSLPLYLSASWADDANASRLYLISAKLRANRRPGFSRSHLISSRVFFMFTFNYDSVFVRSNNHTIKIYLDYNKWYSSASRSLGITIWVPCNMKQERCLQGCLWEGTYRERRKSISHTALVTPYIEFPSQIYQLVYSKNCKDWHKIIF